MFRIIYSAFAVNGRTNNSHQPWIRSFGKMMQAQYVCVYVLLAKIHKLQPYHKFHPAMCCCRCKSMEIWCAFYFVCFINHRLCSLARKLWLCHPDSDDFKGNFITPIQSTKCKPVEATEMWVWMKNPAISTIYAGTFVYMMTVLASRLNESVGIQAMGWNRVISLDWHLSFVATQNWVINNLLADKMCLLLNFLFMMLLVLTFCFHLSRFHCCILCEDLLMFMLWFQLHFVHSRHFQTQHTEYNGYIE